MEILKVIGLFYTVILTVDCVPTMSRVHYRERGEKSIDIANNFFTFTTCLRNDIAFTQLFVLWELYEFFMLSDEKRFPIDEGKHFGNYLMESNANKDFMIPEPSAAFMQER